MQKIKNVIK